MRTLLSVGERILSLLYPPRCAFCHNLMPDGVSVCAYCRRTLPYTQGAGQSRKLTHISQCVSPLYYEGVVRDSLLRYKFRSLSGYAAVYGEFLTKCIDENGISCDSICWVPLSRGRKWKRGYDQAQLLAQEISRRTGVPCERLLRKIRNNPAQSGTKSAAVRRENVKGVYRACDPEAIRGKSILLVDDIVTTGSTLSECASVLMQAGARQVSAATVACSGERKEPLR